MTESVAYLDASAAVKLMVAEPEQDALARRLSAFPSWVSSELLSVELLCTARRVGGASVLRRAEELLAGIDLLTLSGPIRRRAGEAFRPAQRALDAVHLATVLSLQLGDELVLFSYDRDQLAAAGQLGVRSSTPE